MVSVEERNVSNAHGSNRFGTGGSEGNVLQVPRGEPFSIRVSVKPGEKWVENGGYDVAWVRVFFNPDGGSVFEVGNFELASGDGGSPVTLGQSIIFGMLIHEPGELMIMTYSIAEGLVLNSRRFEVLD